MAYSRQLRSFELTLQTGEAGAEENDQENAALRVNSTTCINICLRTNDLPDAVEHTAQHEYGGFIPNREESLPLSHFGVTIGTARLGVTGGECERGLMILKLVNLVGWALVILSFVLFSLSGDERRKDRKPH